MSMTKLLPMQKRQFVLIRVTPVFFIVRGTAWGEKGEPDKALEDFDHALRLDPNNQQALHNRSIALSLKNRAGKK